MVRYQIPVRKLPGDAKIGTVFHENEGKLIANSDLLALADNSYVFFPNAEMDDMQSHLHRAGERRYDYGYPTILPMIYQGQIDRIRFLS